MFKRFLSICFAVVLCLSTVLFGMVSSAPAEAAEAAADDLVFYEGNDCTQDIVFGYPSTEAFDENCQESGNRCYGDNDEARSLLISVFTQVGVMIEVYDSPDADTTDDYSRILVQEQLPEQLCLGTFEESKDYGPVIIEHVHANGLDGKISHVTITP